MTCVNWNSNKNICNLDNKTCCQSQYTYEKCYKLLKAPMIFKNINDNNHRQCNNCDHKCITFNDGKTFAINAIQGAGCIWLNENEYAPCGQKLTLKNSYSDQPDQSRE